MGTTSEKLTYLNDTKQLLKDKINNLGGSIDDNTTFRNYANQLQNVYDNLPKTEYQEGSSITLENTLKGKLDFEDGIVGIGDTSQKSYEGYNELNIYAVHPIGYTETVSGVTIKYNNDGSVTATGTATADINYFLGSRASLGDMFNGTYYLSGCKTGSNTTYYLSMWAEGIGVYPQTTTEVATNKTSGVNWNIVIAVKNGASVNYTFYPMMSKTSGKSFEPYTNGASPNPSYPQTINSVTGNQDVVVSGKNMLYIADTIETTERGITKKSKDGVISLNGEASGSGSFTFGFFTLPKGTWRLSKNLTGTIASASWQNYIRDENNNNLVAGEGSFTTDQDVRCQFYMWVNSGTDFQNVQMKPQLERGTEATTYEPYITPTSHQLSLGDIELCGIGNYKDELIYDVENDKVYKNEAIGKVVLNGTETWTKGETEQYRRFSTSNISTLKQTTGRIECLSNYFKYDYSATGHNVGTIFTYWTENGSIFVYPETTITTAEQLKTWLSTHNTIVYFILETPTLTEITSTLKDQIKALYYSHSFTGTTILTSNGDLPLVIKVRALKGES